MPSIQRQDEFLVGDRPRFVGRLGFADVDVTAVDEPGRITVHIEASGRGAQSLLDDVRVEQDGPIVRVDTPRLTFVFGSAPQLRIRVTVPQDAGVQVTAGSGDVVLRGRLDGARIRTGSGDVQIDRGSDIEVQSGSGDVRIGDAAALAVKTGSGNLRAEHIERASLSTGSGRIEIDSGSDVEATCGSGEIDAGALDGVCALRTGSGGVTVRRAGAGSLSAVSGSGSIRVAIVGGIAANLDVRTASGRVHSTLEPTGPAEPGTPVLVLNASANSGSVRLDRAV